MLLLPDQFTPGFAAPAAAAGASACWFIFAGHRLLVLDNTSGTALPSGGSWPLRAPPLRQIYMGQWQQTHCVAAEIDADHALDTSARLLGLREVWGVLEGPLVGLAGQGLQLVDWDRSHQFCGRCGAPTARRDNERSRHCGACGQNHYPRVAPAIMVRITRGDDILLARSPRFAPGMYSVLAGFVDPGESLEQAVRREVREEVSLDVRNLRYLRSQSWPFPHSLMVAFSAEYDSGDIVPADGEIEDAGWYRYDRMPGIPPPISIARFLIDDYLRRYPASA